VTFPAESSNGAPGDANGLRHSGRALRSRRAEHGPAPKDNAELIELLKHLRDAATRSSSSSMIRRRCARRIIDRYGTRSREPRRRGHCVRRAGGSLARQPLSHRTIFVRAVTIALPSERRKGAGKGFVIKNARARNLKNLTVEIPIGVMTCVTACPARGKARWSWRSFIAACNNGCSG